MMYDIILADPPWNFETWSKKGRSKSPKYLTQPQNWIEALNVGARLAKRDSVLFIWATWPMILQAFSTLDAWGYTYKTEAWVWVKSLKDGTGLKMGLGYYTRGNSEPCLLATRGKVLRPHVKDELAIIYAPAREHSRKPDEQYNKIERMYPLDSYDHVELFARYKRDGWSAWGNEIESDIIL